MWLSNKSEELFYDGHKFNLSFFWSINLFYPNFVKNAVGGDLIDVLLMLEFINNNLNGHLILHKPKWLRILMIIYCLLYKLGYI